MKKILVLSIFVVGLGSALSSEAQTSRPVNPGVDPVEALNPKATEGDVGAVGCNECIKDMVHVKLDANTNPKSKGTSGEGNSGNSSSPEGTR